jgi:hypothetical protein
MNRGDIIAIQRLKNGEEVQRSKVPRHVEQMIGSGIVAVRQKGSGQVIYVLNKAAFDGWVARQFPSGTQGALDAMNTPIGARRTAGVEAFKNSKALPGLGFEFVLVRMKDISSHRGWDAAAVAVEDRPAPFAWPGPVKRVALVENLEFFRSVRLDALNVCAAVHYGGRMSPRLMRWCAIQDSHIEYSVCADYDLVGVQECLRISDGLPQFVTMYVPENLESYFQRYAMHSLLVNQRQFNASITVRVSKPPVPAGVLEVLSQIRRAAACVEQESLLNEAIGKHPIS